MDFSSLVETLNHSGGSFAPLAVCSLLGVLLVGLIIFVKGKGGTRRSPFSSSSSAIGVNVDDEFLHFDRQSKGNASKKTKQKKTQLKATSNATSENTNNSNHVKLSSKQQSPVKSLSKEKQIEEKTKTVQKKGVVASAVSTGQQVKQKTAASEDWTVVGSKKKQKTKKTDPSAENLKAKTASDAHINDPEATGSKRTAATEEVTASDKTAESSAVREEILVTNKKNLNEENVLFHTTNGVDVVVEQPVNSIRPPEVLGSLSVESRGGNLGDVQSDEKEPKTKKASKKKKSKSAAENPTSNVQAEEKTVDNPVVRDVKSQTKKTKPLPSEVSAASGPSEDISKVSIKDVIVPLPKDKSAGLLKATSEAASKNKTAAVTSTSSETKASDKKFLELPVGSSGAQNVHEINVSGNTPVENTISAANSSETSISGGTQPSQIVFDELGLKDDALDSAQPSLKKKKKARRDV